MARRTARQPTPDEVRERRRFVEKLVKQGLLRGEIKTAFAERFGTTGRAAERYITRACRRLGLPSRLRPRRDGLSPAVLRALVM